MIRVIADDFGNSLQSTLENDTVVRAAVVVRLLRRSDVRRGGHFRAILWRGETALR